MFIEFTRSVYDYREYLKQSVIRDLRTKYKRSVLGYLWTMLHPLAMMSIIAVVFSQIMRIPIKDYAIFLFAGLLPWNYFQSTALMSLGSIRNNARLFGQIALPKYIFILSLAASNLVNYFLAIIPLFLIMLIIGRPIELTTLALPIVILPLILVVVGISLILATANVFFDDTLHLTEVGLQALYFLSPILYDRTMIPSWLVNYLVYNPLFCQIEFIRQIFYSGTFPDFYSFLINLSASLVVLGVGLFVFTKNEDKFLYFV